MVGHQAAQLQQQATTMAGLQQMVQQQQQQKQTRAFVGVVTKMQDNYGFVDDDVFFQLKYVNAVGGDFDICIRLSRRHWKLVSILAI
jgi:hypothetical protein